MRILLFIMIILLSSHSKDIIKQGKDYPIDKFKEQNSKIIKMVVKEISKTLPQKIDKYTTITGVRDENLTLIYTFEINTGAKSDKAVIKDDKARMERAVTRGLCRTSKRFLDADIELEYEYKSAVTKNRLFTFHITKESCMGLKYD